MYDVVFDESFSIALSCTSQPYSEAMVMHPAVTYTQYVTSSKEQTGDVITLAQFEEGVAYMISRMLVEEKESPSESRNS